MTGNEDFASLFGEFEKKQGMTSKKEPRTGDKVIGTVVSIQSRSEEHTSELQSP